MNFDLHTLSERDFSLVEMSIQLGANLERIQADRQIKAQSERIGKLIGLVDELAISYNSVTAKYGKTPWRGDRA